MKPNKIIVLGHYKHAMIDCELPRKFLCTRDIEYNYSHFAERQSTTLKITKKK